MTETPYGVYTPDQARRVVEDLSTEAKLAYHVLDARYPASASLEELVDETLMAHEETSYALQELEAEGVVRARSSFAAPVHVYRLNVEADAV